MSISRISPRSMAIGAIAAGATGAVLGIIALTVASGADIDYGNVSSWVAVFAAASAGAISLFNFRIVLRNEKVRIDKEMRTRQSKLIGSSTYRPAIEISLL